MIPTAKPDTVLAEHFVVVLNETQDIVNIAGTVRAMLNTGLWRLRLVKPQLFDSHRIAGIAHGSEALLEQVEFFDTLDAALADARHIVATTARRRAAAYLWQHPREAAPALLSFAVEHGGPVALVFGREDAGLSNEELDRCDRLLVIPVNPAHVSLNLAQAVLLIGYELWLANLDRAPSLPQPKRRSTIASPEHMRLLFEDARCALETIEFFKTRKPDAVMRSVRAAFRRADMTDREAKLLRAIFIEVRKFIDRTRSVPKI